MEKTFQIREIRQSDKPWILEYIKNYWGSNIIVSRRKRYSIDKLYGFIAIHDTEYVGLVTLKIDNQACQIITMDAIIENIGIGTSLLEKAIEYAIAQECRKVWLITTNDNTPALRFYQTRGFRLKAIYCNEIEFSRKLKPEIPTYGIDSIPIRDEIELEYAL